ncbi:hypothetical protein V7O66_13990 [Methanolobus sp. ZRKC3]|uniref:hypothetical protein n=1 Tax=Methanolobus sp. ZRKC3 TaxID=3125786 RepID=UPI00324BFFA2
MMPDQRVKTVYDEEYDILYLIVGLPAAADAEFVADDVYLRRDSLTESIAGAVIENYSNKDADCLSQLLPMGLGRFLPKGV